MDNFYKFLLEKFGVKKGEKFAIIHFDIDSTYYYRDCYFDGKGIVNGENGKKYFTTNFIFKLLNGQYTIIKESYNVCTD